MSLETICSADAASKSNVQRSAVFVFWLGVVAFSSTSFAGRWADSAFETVAGAPFFHFRSMGPFQRSMIHFLAEKEIHLLMFTVLAVLLYGFSGRAKSKARFVLGVGGAIGIVSELLQGFFPGRDPSLRDAVINLAGTCLGFTICSVAERLKQRHV